MRRFTQHVGRRGAFLVAHGVLALMLGYSYTIAEVTPAVKHSLHYALSVMPLWGYGLVWLVSGVLSIVTGLWLRRFEVLGFIGAITAPVLWSLVMFTADYPTRIVLLSGGIYLAYAIPVGIVAGMPDVPRREPRE